MSDHSLWSFRIRHILEAIGRIEEYSASLSSEEFFQNRLVRDAVERNFEIIGEASSHIPDDFKNKTPDIPWRQMKSMRNFIAHQYDEVQEVAVWNTVQQDLPVLKEKLLKLKPDE